MYLFKVETETLTSLVRSLSVSDHLNILLSHQVPKYLSQQWDKAPEKGEVGKITIGKYELHSKMFILVIK